MWVFLCQQFPCISAPTVHLQLQVNVPSLRVYSYRLWGTCWTQMSTYPHCTPDAITQRQGPRPPTHASTPACTLKAPTFLLELPRVSIPALILSRLTSPCPPTSTLKALHFPNQSLHIHFSAASCVRRCFPRERVLASLPTTLGSFCLRSGIRGNFMLMRLNRPHSRCGAFFLPSESSLQGRGLSEGAGLGRGLEREVRSPRRGNRKGGT